MTIFQENECKNHFFDYKVVVDHHIRGKHGNLPPLCGQKSGFGVNIYIFFNNNILVS